MLWYACIRHVCIIRRACIIRMTCIHDYDLRKCSFVIVRRFWMYSDKPRRCVHILLLLLFLYVIVVFGDILSQGANCWRSLSHVLETWVVLVVVCRNANSIFTDKTLVCVLWCLCTAFVWYLISDPSQWMITFFDQLLPCYKLLD